MRFVPFLIPIVLLLWALFDCLQTEERSVRSLPKALWMLLVVLVPVVGPVGWFLAGRPRGGGPVQGSREGRYLPYEPPRGLAPDDDPAFLARLREQSAAEHEDLLKKWEADLRRREDELRRRRGDDPDAPAS